MPSFLGAYDNETLAIPYGFSMTGANRLVALGILDFNYNLADTHLYMKIVNPWIALNGFWVNVSSNAGSYFLSGVMINYLTVDAAFTQPFSISYFTSVLFSLNLDEQPCLCRPI